MNAARKPTADELQMEVMVAYRFNAPLTDDERRLLATELTTGTVGLHALFSPAGHHLFVLGDSPVSTRANGEIMGAEIDIIVPAIEKVRPEPPGKINTTEVGTGWHKMYDATHGPGCKCDRCKED